MKIYSNLFLSLFIDGIRKRSWLQMLNPLAKHQPTRTNDLTTGDANDFETSVSSPDATGYTGEN